MTIATLKREVQQLKKRQSLLERTFSQFIQSEHIRQGEDREEIRPDYLRKLQRISKDMDKGKGITVIKTRRALRQFFEAL